MPKFKNSNETFWLIFKHCVLVEKYSKLSLKRNFGVTTSCKRILGFVQESKTSVVTISRHSIGISQQYTLGIWKLSLFYKSVFYVEFKNFVQRFFHQAKVAVLTSTKCLSRWSDSNLTLVLRQKSFRQRIFHFVNRTRAKKKRKNLSFSKFLTSFWPFMFPWVP